MTKTINRPRHEIACRDRAARIAAYLKTKELTSDEKAQLKAISKNLFSARNQSAMFHLSNPIFRGDSRQIIGRLEAIRNEMRLRDRKELDRITYAIESARYLQDGVYSDLLKMAAEHQVDVSGLTTVRGEPSVETEPRDNSLNRYFTIRRAA
ncbi:hypothetical protein AMC81_PA00109 (plasmid) [Rhizobium phaseoli]|uniref:Uncharacterized protein n=2 Tax=Rhizobium phaseoli TaxID=396 RepID=A0ABM6CFS6_9HYPH|nr:hypothetical protein AMC81_PA00109 [Rhizobium phaseoli]ANL93639.1 hypothetical protein AMC80_PA00109 [Rhizobium phaseoli]